MWVGGGCRAEGNKEGKWTTAIASSIQYVRKTKISDLTKKEQNRRVRGGAPRCPCALLGCGLLFSRFPLSWTKQQSKDKNLKPGLKKKLHMTVDFYVSLSGIPHVLLSGSLQGQLYRFEIRVSACFFLHSVDSVSAKTKP